jgi:soluble lytic murein transglycosylase-like protein
MIPRLLLLHRLSLFGRSAGPFLVPDKTASADARSRGQGRPTGRRAQRLALEIGELGRTLSNTGTWQAMPRAARATAALFLIVAVGADLTVSRRAEAAPVVQVEREIDVAIAEASARFGLSTPLIWAVVMAESGGRPDALSPKGAMGLMQLMPAAWSEMRAELGLGDDPFGTRDNVLAGAGYLRALYDRFGSPGYLAAYNAGPGRYQRHLNGVASLPRETRAYVVAVRRRAASEAPVGTIARTDWRASALFVGGGVGEAGLRSVFVSSAGEGRP